MDIERAVQMKDLDRFEPYQTLENALKEEIEITESEIQRELETLYMTSSSNGEKLLKLQAYLEGLKFIINQKEIWKKEN